MPSDLMRDRVIAAIGDLYDVDEELGRGGMSVVYLATDLRLRRRVAIKVLPPELNFRADVRARFQREAETAAGLSHPNIVPIYSVDERDGLVYFVMALVQGDSLGACLTKSGPMVPDEARRILRGVADALSYAHSRGVVHRDIKPDNILLDAETGRPMVTDFGIARAAEADSRLTVTGAAMGTPAYMSPEQALGERDVDGRSDIYSLGVVAYQMLVGEPPFAATNTPSMLMKHVSELPRPLAGRRGGIPPALCSAIERALAKRPSDRWSDAASFRDALDGLIDAGPASAPPAPPHHWRAPAGPGVHHQQPAASSQGSSPGHSPGAETAHVPRPQPWMRAPGQGSAAQGNLPLPDFSHLRPLSRRARREMERVRRRQENEEYEQMPIAERVRIFRRTFAGCAASSGFLFVINMTTSPVFPWFIFPTMAMGIGVAKKWGSLWGAGLSTRQIFGRDPLPLDPGAPRPSLPSARDEAEAVAPPEVLASEHGAAVHRVIADRSSIRLILDGLSGEDRALLPEILPTVDALVMRAASLAGMMQRLDADCSTESVARLEARIAEVEAEPASAADRERRQSLLNRQRATVQDLVERRKSVASQLDSVLITLENLKLDLLKLRSAGVKAALEDVTSATREARALSRDIGHVLEAARELRSLQ
jgi:serine/threonine-protein kinase